MMYHKFAMVKKHMFFHPNGKEGDSFRFSSDLAKIGQEWDVAIQNGTYVDVISEPVEIERPQYGRFVVIKIKADVATDYHTIIREFWVPVQCVIEVGNNATQSTQLANRPLRQLRGRTTGRLSRITLRKKMR